ncbi:type II toxin-antitoxin system VapC family toxin [Romeria aff. gracilis LEGE 07310]|uniref:Type II toxin-antitoxin system VapC family toxin n=1 Tax=Vasconcelosia minhoensis LEGE 07310 TaxID=915328 RepID=A0A8J7DMC7_9CYAN|nr:type II toxin-antitoxin system VapC family toxin [Romeria gracilis]MBE9076355.1 type II toxin-antitoxin system VapC family toxin [Romeria aff. gracilis LEGE 07310]
MSKYVLDASAILAFLNEEPGSERVAQVIEGASVSTVNLSEVITKLIDTEMPEDEIALVMDYLAVQIQVYDPEDAWHTARLRAATRNQGLSLGDRACLGLAQKLGHTALTADRAWGELAIDIPVELLR